MSEDFAVQQQQTFQAALNKLQSGPELQLQVGTTMVRIVSAFNKDGTRRMEFWKAFVVHWNVGPNKRLVRCLRPEGQTCYICDYVKSLAEAGHTDAAGRSQASNRYAMAAVNIAIEPPDVKVLAVGAQVLEGILAIATNPSWGDPSDQKNGYAVAIMKQGTGLGTKYSVNPDGKRMPIPDKWLEDLPDLENYYQLFSVEQQQLIVAGQDPNQAAQQVGTGLPPVAAPAVATPVVAPPVNGVAPPAVAPPEAAPPVNGVAPPVVAPQAAPPPPGVGTPVNGTVPPPPQG